MSKQIAIVSVTNDLTTDQRVDRTCRTLVRMGYAVTLVGRKLPKSKPLDPREYQMHRMQLLFDKGALFYAEYNVRLLLFLLGRPKRLLVSNDLDALPANYLALRIAHIFGLIKASSPPFLLHDCHEYFRGVPELVGRKGVTAFWKWIEDRIFPKLRHVVAVNQSVADLYTHEYGNKITVVRNVPLKKDIGEPFTPEMGLDHGQKIILYQGAINIDRGIEEAILAMKYLKSDALLLIAGIGDIFDKLTGFAAEQGVSSRVKFLGQIPFSQLHRYTRMADIGLSIEKDVSINYHFALPNKFMDYIQANVPVLVSPFPEMKAIVDQYQIGEFLESHDPQTLANQIDRMLADTEKMLLYKKNLVTAANNLCWENEEKTLINLLEPLNLEP
jgi:glycosyltransferase involved in cell wall biosynthesis